MGRLLIAGVVGNNNHSKKMGFVWKMKDFDEELDLRTYFFSNFIN